MRYRYIHIYEILCVVFVYELQLIYIQHLPINVVFWLKPFNLEIKSYV